MYAIILACPIALHGQKTFHVLHCMMLNAKNSKNAKKKKTKQKNPHPSFSELRQQNSGKGSVKNGSALYSLISTPWFP